jgi:hypothetical protein
MEFIDLKSFAPFARFLSRYLQDPLLCSSIDSARLLSELFARVPRRAHACKAASLDCQGRSCHKNSMSSPGPVVPIEAVQGRIFVIRGLKVMLDQDLAELYGVSTAALNQAVARNRERFPEDFMFELTNQEFSHLLSQIVRSSWGGRRTPPNAFTEQGVAMLSGVLRSQRAVQANIAIMRAFVRMREAMLAHEEMARRLDYLESRYDAQFKAVFDALRELMMPADNTSPKPIGFVPHQGEE